jgi:hypothetical protein
MSEHASRSLASRGTAERTGMLVMYQLWLVRGKTKRVFGKLFLVPALTQEEARTMAASMVEGAVADQFLAKPLPEPERPLDVNKFLSE